MTPFSTKLAIYRLRCHIAPFLIILLQYFASTRSLAMEQRFIKLKMPDVRPTHDESYLCTAQRLNLTDHEYIVGFTPDASAQKVHHILIYGCSSPGKFMRDTPKYVWECGEMNLMSDNEITPSTYDSGSVCGPGSSSIILFGWALDAPAIEMPPQVGFKIGGATGINYLVLQVHYGNTEPFRRDLEATDNSGIILHSVHGSNHGITKNAGIYLLVTNGYVPVGRSQHTVECLMQEDKVLHPFRFRTHTHKLGLKVGAYKKPASNPVEPILIGDHDPQKPQMFYPVEDKSLTIQKGDRIFAYCDYYNTRGKTVYIGPTGNDEMCNFYMMYWTEGELLKEQDCLAYNPH